MVSPIGETFRPMLISRATQSAQDFAPVQFSSPSSI